jgi:cytidylate kinase
MRSKKKALVIAIDGPAGSGKSTVSKIIAKRLGLLYIDTGAMYRALTLKAMNAGADLEDAQGLTELARSTKIELKDGPKLRVFLDGKDVSEAIRTVEVTDKIKHVARVPGVRHEMVSLQREIGRRANSVLEGRDIGTVVFPDAEYKFYLDADVEDRARRRREDFMAAGKNIELDVLIKDVKERDASDINRPVGPLKKAPDAIVIDTTGLSVDGVVEKILSYVK